MSVRKRNKTFPDHLDGDAFADIFRHLEMRPNARVNRVLELLSHLEADDKKAEVLRTVTELRNVLSAYKWVFQIAPTKEGLRAIPIPVSDTEPDDRWEYAAVRDLLSLVGGNLWRLRRCDYVECKRWIFAKKRDRRFCANSFCRQKHYLTDEHAYVKHKESVRQYDSRQRQADKRAREQVRLSLLKARRNR